MARLGPQKTSGLSLSSPGRAVMVLNAFFSINRREGELRKGFQHLVVKELRKRERRRKKKRKQSRGVTGSRLGSISTSFFVRCSSCDCQLVLFLRFECDLCTLRGLPCFVHVLLILSSVNLIFCQS